MIKITNKIKAMQRKPKHLDRLDGVFKINIKSDTNYLDFYNKG